LTDDYCCMHRRRANPRLWRFAYLCLTTALARTTSRRSLQLRRPCRLLFDVRPLLSLFIMSVADNTRWRRQSNRPKQFVLHRKHKLERRMSQGGLKFEHHVRGSRSEYDESPGRLIFFFGTDDIQPGTLSQSAIPNPSELSNDSVL
jgi:hypothetical protein